jgi:hypothetical protein
LIKRLTTTTKKLLVRVRNNKGVIMLTFSLRVLLIAFCLNWLVLFSVDSLSATRTIDLIGETVAAFLLAVMISFDIKK